MGNFRREGGFGRSSSGGRFGRSGGRFGRDRPEMHEVTCDKCGKQCEVPFNPTEGKPVFCSDCFRNTERGSSKSLDLEEINKKLDKIISLLENNAKV